MMAADARPLVWPDRSCTKLDGTRKIAFMTRREALRVRRLKRVLDQHPYRCSNCGAIHLGHRLPANAL